ncbi:MAG: lamin tail domain-containing protein, partial [Saprospiraceae bacterium]|nr:lamin tail domain-containing protein [Saprospiraceae bacterium]
MKIKNYYSHLVTLLLCFWIMQPIFSQNIVITEIMYNPPESGTDSLEYIELYNSGNTTINLEGYSMTGVTLTFPSFEIPANAFAIVCVNDTAFTNVFGATAHLIQSTGGGLSNTGELIEVKDPNGTTVASVTYADAGEWPIEPDGAGASLELCSVSADMALPINWKAATLSTGATVNGIEIFASPGSANSVICGELPDHTITVSSFQFSPADITIYVGETVEWNNISGTHNVNGTQSTFPSNPESFGNAVGGSPWSYQYTFTIPGVNHFQCDPHSGQMQGTVTVIEVPPPVIRNIVITEIMYNDPSANDTLEFIEIYNNDTLAVNLGGYQFTQGVNYTFPAITLNVGDFLVVAKDSQIFQNSFGFPAFDWVNSQALANAGETIELRDNNNNVVDAVTYDNTGSWDPAANGNGASLVLCDFNSDNNVGANWRGSTTTTSIVLENIVISANPYEASDCPTGLSLVNDEYTTDVNVSFPLNVLLNDQLTANYEIQIPGTTALGTIGVVNGAITYIPNADVCGDDVFIYMVTDVASGVMDTATVTVHIINCPLNYPVRTITSVTSENSDGVADSLNVI